MDPTSLFLVVVAAIFLLGVIGEMAFERTGVPDVVWLIAVGMLLGPVTGLVSREILSAVAPYFGAITLVIVLFDGGSGLRLQELRAVVPRASALALLGFVMSTLVVALAAQLSALAGLLPESWGLMHSLMLGTILGGSSSVVLMPALRTAGLSSKLSNLLSLESAITDVLCVVAAASCVRIILTGSVPGIDAVFVGQGDLSAALGDVPDASERVAEMVAKVAEALKAVEVPLMMIPSGPAGVGEARALGANALVLSSDHGFIKSASANALRAHSQA
jgi:NhaP-type Na+/H+ or K+/H+ antiporter